MNINTKNLVSITDANQNFSKVARLVDENGSASDQSSCHAVPGLSLARLTCFLQSHWNYRYTPPQILL